MKVKGIKRILSVGTLNQASYESSKKIEFTNKISLFFMGICLLYAIIFFLLKSPILMAILIACFILYGCGIVLNKYHKYNYTKLLIIINTSLTIFTTTAIIGRDVSSQFFFIFLIPLANMLFTNQHRPLKYLCTSIPIIGFFTLEITNYQFFYHVIFSKGLIHILSISVFVIISIILYFMIEFYKTIFNHVKASLAQIKHLYPITERELEVIEKVIAGNSNKSIATQLFIEESTVKNHLKNIFRKLNVKSRTELLSKCLLNNPPATQK